MAKSKISAPVGFNPKPTKQPAHQYDQNHRRMYNDYLRAWYTSDDGGMSWKRETQQETKAIQETQNVTVSASLGFSLELVPTGKFVTVEFVNKRGEISRYNGRTGVKKYLMGRGVAETIARDNVTGEYFILWVRRAGIKFDSVAMIHKRRIVKLSAGGAVLWQNKVSHYAKTV